MYLARNILLIKAVVIILFHSLIPHRHHGEMTFEEHKITHEKATDIIDYLGLAFHEDSNNKFENYNPVEQNSLRKIDPNGFNFLISTSFAKDKSIFEGERPSFRTRSRKLFIDRTTILANGLRAPPNHDYYS